MIGEEKPLKLASTIIPSGQLQWPLQYRKGFKLQCWLRSKNTDDCLLTLTSNHLYITYRSNDSGERRGRQEADTLYAGVT